MKHKALHLVLACVLLSISTSQPKKIVPLPNVTSEANFYRDGKKLLSDRITVKFKYNVVRAGDDNKPASERIEKQYRDIIGAIQEVEKMGGHTTIKKAIRNAASDKLIKFNRRTGKEVKIRDLSNVFYLTFSQPVDVSEAIKKLIKIPEVEYAQQALSVVYQIAPNDYYFNTPPGQWNLDVIGAVNTWDVTTGNPAVRVGIVDSGVDSTHEDLDNKIFRSDNSISNPHGTFVAGVAGATTNNTLGVASLGYNLKMTSYDIGNPSGSIAEAIEEASIYSDIINMSWTTGIYMTEDDLIEIGCARPDLWENSLKPYNSPLIEDVIANAIDEGVVCVAAAGNTSPNGNFPQAYANTCDAYKIPFACWPAQYPNVIAVSGTDWPTGYSEKYIPDWNYGNFVDVSAPATNLMTTAQYSPYYWAVSGTSFSSPQVAALAGLILSLNPSLTVQQVFDYISKTADKIDVINHSYNGNGWNQYLGYGRINAYKAVQPPTAPSNLSYSNAGGHPRLTWSPSEWDTKSYEIWRDLGSGYVKIAEVNSPTTTYVDNGVMIGSSNPNSAWYFVKSKDLTNLISSASSSLRVRYNGLEKEGIVVSQQPTEMMLYQNHPNPFNPTTNIKYTISDQGYTTIKIFNGLGQEVETLKEEYHEPGVYELRWDASKHSSGLYFCKMSVKNHVYTQKMILLK